jgi:hypothetical protein
MSALARLKQAASSKNLRAVAEKQTHTLALGALGFGLGMYEATGKTLPSVIDAIDPKLQWGVALALLSDRTSGTMRVAARAGADLLIGIGTYQMGRVSKLMGPSVRGYEDDVVDV